jgi:hypothetical protein
MSNLRHAKVSTVPDGSNTDQVQPSDWNAEHVIDGQLELPLNNSPVASPANTSALFSRSIGGRIYPAFIGPSGLDTAMQPLLARNKVAWFNPNGNTTVVTSLGMDVTATGTATAAVVATTNILTATRRIEYAVATAATNAIAGLRSAQLQFHTGDPATPYGGFTWIARFARSRGQASNATRRSWAGMTSVTAVPTDVNPSTWAVNGIGVGSDSTDANWQIMHRNASEVMTKIDTGISKQYLDNTELFELALFTAPTGSTSVGYQFTRLSDGVSASGTITTNLPAADTLLTWQIWNSVGGTSSVVGTSIASIYIETDL